MNPYTLLLSDLRQHLAADAYLADVPVIIDGEGRALAVATRIRDANVATLEFAAPHKLKNLSRVRVEDMGDASFDAENVEITVVDPTTIRYASAGDNQAATAEAVGIVTPLLVPITEAIERGLAEGGLLRGPTNKGGLAISLILLRRSPGDNSVAGARTLTVRATLFGEPLQNASGLKKPMLDVLAAIDQRISAWERGPGCEFPEFAGGGRSNLGEEQLAFWSDFNVFHLFS